MVAKLTAIVSEAGSGIGSCITLSYCGINWIVSCVNSPEVQYFAANLLEWVIFSIEMPYNMWRCLELNTNQVAGISKHSSRASVDKCSPGDISGPSCHWDLAKRILLHSICHRLTWCNQFW